MKLKASPKLTLLRIKGASTAHVSEMVVSYHSLNSGDSFVLLAGDGTHQHS
jgi:hypothetical protein